MDRKRVSTPAPGRQRNRERKEGPRFLELKSIDGKWHAYGTITTDRGSRRVRSSTRLPATDWYREEALDILWALEQEAFDELVSGVIAKATGIAIGEYLELNEIGEPIENGRGDMLGGADRRVIADVTREFGTRVLKSIEEHEWQAFVNERHEGNTADTKRRYVSPIRTFLMWCAAPERRYIASPPDILPKEPKRQRRPKSQKRRDRAQVAMVTSELLAFVLDHAHISLKAQLYAEWSTGARVSSILFGCRLSDLVIGESAAKITFRETKNGDDVTADLHPATVDVLLEYLKWRGDLHRRNDPLFLTYKRLAYSDRGRKLGWSGQNKTGFNAMKRRAIIDLRDTAAAQATNARHAGRRDDAWSIINDARMKTGLILKLTQHWLRHWFATHALAIGMPRAAVMAQGGWRDERSMERYEHDIPDVRQLMIGKMAIGRKLTDSKKEIANALKRKGDFK